jgi:flagellar L-ring protein FlgH
MRAQRYSAVALALTMGTAVGQEATPDPAVPPTQPAWIRRAPNPSTSPVTVVKPSSAQQPRAQPVTRESLYSEGSFQSLTSDRRLHRVGDLITVLIYENASASSSADTGAMRDGSVGVNVARTAVVRNVGVNTSNEFSGVGRTQRAGRILAQLTVTVQDVAANADLMLAGEQQLEINGEKQVIRLEGRVRPRDVTELNTVMSTRIADARIAFIGDGVVADRQRPGWWQYVLGLFGL